MATKNILLLCYGTSNEVKDSPDGRKVGAISGLHEYSTISSAIKNNKALTEATTIRLFVSGDTGARNDYVDLLAKTFNKTFEIEFLGYLTPAVSYGDNKFEAVLTACASHFATSFNDIIYTFNKYKGDDEFMKKLIEGYDVQDVKGVEIEILKEKSRIDSSQYYQYPNSFASFKKIVERLSPGGQYYINPGYVNKGFVLERDEILAKIRSKPGYESCANFVEYCYLLYKKGEINLVSMQSAMGGILSIIGSPSLIDVVYKPFNDVLKELGIKHEDLKVINNQTCYVKPAALGGRNSKPRTTAKMTTRTKPRSKSRGKSKSRSKSCSKSKSRSKSKSKTTAKSRK